MGGSDARHRLLIESWAQAVWEADADGLVIADSPSWRAYTGQSLEEWLGYGWLNAIHPDDRAHAARQWREALAARSPVDAEFRFRASGGGWRWTNVRAAPVLDARGQVEKWVGMNVDIDARKRAEAALRNSEKTRDLALAAAEMGTWDYDLVADVCHFDKRAKAMYGLSADDLDHRPDGVASVVHPEDARPMFDAIQRASDPAGDGRYDIDYRIARGDGSFRWLRAWGKAEFEGEGAARHAVRILGASRDVTTEKNTEAALRESEARYQALFAASPVPFMVLASNTPDFTIVAANEAYFAVTLTTREGLIGRRLFDVFPDDKSRLGQLGSEALAISLGRVLAERRADAMERVRYDLVTPEGFEPHWWEAINAPMLDRSGQVSAIIHQVHRVTELHRAEEAERENQEYQAVVLRLSDTLRPLDDPGAIAEAACRLLVEELEASRAQYTVMTDDTPGAEIAEVQGESLGSGKELVRRFPMNAFGAGLVDFLRSGRTLVLNDVETDARMTDDQRAMHRGAESAAAISVPCVKNCRLVVTLTVHDRQSRRWTAREIALVEEIAERTWAAVERARAEAALRASEARFRTLADTAPALIWQNDADGGNVFINQYFLDFTSKSAQAICGEGWHALVHPDEAEAYIASYLAAVRDRRGWQNRNRIRRHDGAWRWFENYAQPLFGEDGRYLGHVGVSTDVTAAVEVAESLRESEARFRALATVGSSTVYRMSPDWHEMRHLDGAGFLLDTEEPTAGWIDTYIPPDERPRIRAAIDRAMAAKDSFELGHRVLLKDGTVGWTFSRAIPLLDEDGEIREWFGAAIDVTARVKADQRFTRLFRASPTPFLVLKPDAPRFTVSEVNDAYLAATMRARDEVVGRGIFEAYPDNPDDAAIGGVSTLRASLERVLATHRPDRLPSLKYDIARPDGTFEERWWSPVNSAVLDEGGAAEAIIHNANDVTEERHAEAALRESEGRFRGFAENSADVLWIANATGTRMEYLSPAFDRIFGADRDAVRADPRRLRDLVHPDDRALFDAAMPRTLAGEKVVIHYRVIRPAGDVVHLRDTAFQIRDDAGTIRQIAGVVQDVSDIAAAQAALEAGKERFRTLVEGIPQLVWRSADDGLWTWASPQWQAYTGQTQASSHGWGWLDAIHPDDREATRLAWHKARPHGRLEVEYRVRRAVDGTWRWHQTRSVPVRNGPTPEQPEGLIREWLGTTTDIEDLKRLQGQQGVLVAELQHRTRNLLAVVRNVARRSIDPSLGLDQYDARLAALGRVQGFLSRSTAYAVPLADLVQAELDAVGDGTSDRVTVDGPGVELPGESVQAVALALHELATNALKYGAIAQPSGRLSVTWHIESDDRKGSRSLVINWRESGVDMQPGPPARPGYGSELITRALPYQLKAETSLEFTGSGVRCRIVVPKSAFDSSDTESVA